MRSYERDNDGEGWHDALLMELIAGDQREGGELRNAPTRSVG
jgi:hypothetical protein